MHFRRLTAAPFFMILVQAEPCRELQCIYAKERERDSGLKEHKEWWL